MDISYRERRFAFDNISSPFQPLGTGWRAQFYSSPIQCNLSIAFKKGEKMNTNKMTAVMKDKKVILSTLWIFAVLNYIYADIFNLFFNPEAQSGTMTQGAAMGFAFLMEIAIAMVLLSRILKYGANRWTNIAAGVIHTALVSWSLFGETPLPFYIFFAAIEIACTLFIVWYAWRWRQQEV
jgi:hypothetical protein